jgi:RpiB/LacA/LacB family sugar-phosphate isomerase
MNIAVACDHAGFAYKERVLEVITRLGHTVLDLGTHSADPVDYPDYARAAGGAIQRGEVDRGIVLCGSGVGACIAANKMKGVRAGVCHDPYSAHQGVEHDDMNLLTLGARVIGIELVPELVTAFLGAKFSGDPRHQRRLAKISSMEL